MMVCVSISIGEIVVFATHGVANGSSFVESEPGMAGDALGGDPGEGGDRHPVVPGFGRIPCVQRKLICSRVHAKSDLVHGFRHEFGKRAVIRPGARAFFVVHCHVGHSAGFRRRCPETDAVLGNIRSLIEPALG